MANKRTKATAPSPLPAPAPTRPAVPVAYCDTFEYRADDGVVTFYFGFGERWVAGVAMSVNLARDLQLKLGGTLNPVKPAHIPL